MYGACTPGSGVWMPNMLVGINNSPISRTTVPATTGENAAWQKRGEEIVGRRLRLEPILTAGDLDSGSQATPAESSPGSTHEQVQWVKEALGERGTPWWEMTMDERRVRWERELPWPPDAD